MVQNFMKYRVDTISSFNYPVANFEQHCSFITSIHNSFSIQSAFNKFQFDSLSNVHFNKVKLLMKQYVFAVLFVYQTFTVYLRGAASEYWSMRLHMCMVAEIDKNIYTNTRPWHVQLMSLGHDVYEWLSYRLNC